MDTPWNYKGRAERWRLRELHYGYIDWTLTTGDGGGPTYLSPEEFMHNVTDYSSEFNVISVLMHDYSTNTLIALNFISSVFLLRHSFNTSTKRDIWVPL